MGLIFSEMTASETGGQFGEPESNAMATIFVRLNLRFPMQFKEEGGTT